MMLLHSPKSKVHTQLTVMFLHLQDILCGSGSRGVSWLKIADLMLG